MKFYTIYVRPKLEYCTPVWSPWMMKNIRKIESIQRSFTRKACMRCGITFKSYANRLDRLNLKSLQYRRIVFDLILLFKIINGLSDLKFSDFFMYRNIPYHVRGNSKKISSKHNFKSSQWNHSFFSRVTVIWNLLPDKVCTTTSLRQFKLNLDNFDLSPYLNDVVGWVFLFSFSTILSVFVIVIFWLPSIALLCVCLCFVAFAHTLVRLVCRHLPVCWIN